MRVKSSGSTEECSALEERAVGGLHEWLSNEIATFFGSNRPPVLDIGCGTGAWLQRLQALGFNKLVGLDKDAPNVAGLEIRNHDIDTDAPSSVGSFGLITCIEVIEHVENIGSLLDLISASLEKPNGLAVITTPNVESMRARVRHLLTARVPQFDRKGDPTHLIPILRDSLEKMLSRRGLILSRESQYPVDTSKSVMFGRPVLFASRVMRLFLQDDRYGDNAVYWISWRPRSDG